MLGRSESLTCHGGNVRLVQQAMSNIGAAFDSALANKRRDIRKRIKRALRHRAAPRPESCASRSRYDRAAASIPLSFPHALLRAQSAAVPPSAQSTWDSTFAGSAASAPRPPPPSARACSLAAIRSWHTSSKANPRPESGRGYSFSDPTEKSARVVQVNIALVGNHPDAALVRQAHNLSHVLGAHHRARRIRRRIQNDELRFGVISRSIICAVTRKPCVSSAFSRRTSRRRSAPYP